MCKKYLLFLIPVLIIQCRPKAPAFLDLPEGAQTISLLGDTLKTAEMRSEIEESFSESVKNAEVNYLADSSDIDNIIWMGRRAAYLGDYREAIRIFTRGIAVDSEDPRLYRHRGHRYITLREFDFAIKDLEIAADLIKDTEDQVEPDGLPNAQNMPTSTLHTNIWYHLGLAYYLNGEFEEAHKRFQKCILASDNDDMLVAALYWYYMSLKRAGNNDLAEVVISPVSPEMNIIENDSYLQLLLLFKGDLAPGDLFEEDQSELTSATIGYGIGNRLFMNGRELGATRTWEQIVESDNWAAFGYIASEAELARK